MAQDWYVGIGGKARRITKAYIGVGGKAREIVAGYVGIGGKARQFWSGGKVKFIGTVEKTRHTYYETTNTASYLLFGSYPSEDSPHIDAYNNNLVRSNCPDYKYGRGGMGAARAGNYALFGGGHYSSGSHYDTVEVYDNNLTHTTTSLVDGYYQTHGCSAGTTGIIGIGKTASNSTSGSYSNDYNFFSSSLVRTTSTIGSDYKRRCPCTVSTGTYGIFAGGLISTTSTTHPLTTIDAFNQNQVRTGLLLSERRYWDETTRAGVAINGNAIIPGGQERTSGSYGYLNIVDVINPNLVRSTISPLSVSREPISALVKDKAVIVGAQNFGLGDNKEIANRAIDVYDKNLVRTNELGNIPNTYGYGYAYTSGTINGQGLFLIATEASTNPGISNCVMYQFK